MTRTRLRACLFLAPLALAARTATAQTLITSPGSTVPGDILQGQAALAFGAGINSLYSAQARSLDARSLIELSDARYRSIRQHNLDREQRLARRLKRSIDLHNLRQKDLRDNPDYGDLVRGDALNVVLEDLWDPKIHPSVLRYVTVPLSVSEVHALPFRINRLGGTISRRTLTVDNGNGWPVELKIAPLDAQRKAYSAAVDALLEENLEGRLTLETVRAVGRAVAALQAGVEGTLPKADRFYIPAQNFLRELDEQARLLESPLVRQFLADMEKYPGTTVADLVELMRWYNLRFAPAAEGTPEREVVAHLYEALVAQRDQVAKMVGTEEVQREVPASEPPP